MFEKIKNLFNKPNDEIVVTTEPVKKPKVNKKKGPAKPKAELTTTEPVKKPKVNKKKETTKPKVELTPKQKATEAGEPYIDVLRVEIDPENINSGAFELDWNDKFIANLIRAGYKLRKEDTDSDIVDRWFTEVCRGVVLEMYEQEQADPEVRNQQRVINRKDLGDGRTEVS